MALTEKLNELYKSALKNKNSADLNVIRSLKSALKNAEIDKKTTLTNEDEITIIRKQLKQRKDSLDSYTKANRSDLADIEKKEITFLEQFLPKAPSQKEIQEHVTSTIKKLNASTKADMGKVMGALKKQFGSSIDGATLSQAVLKELS